MRNRGLAARWGTTVVTSALIATLLLVGSPARVGVATSPSAATTYLCSGYSGCSSAGFSDAGYGAVSGKMYWQMYSGHNCTNYAAYRVIKSGGPATRPWTGLGNASEWGLRMASITDQVPNVGAIAWWGRYSNGSGSAGHVAYVERVVSSTEIVISEDSWGGTFHWRTITKSSGRWPTGFIHFTDKRIVAKAAPKITGTSAVGSALTASAGSWSVSPSSLTYTWLVGGVSTGVVTPTFTPRAADLGKPVTVTVRARRAGYTDGVQTSVATAAVARGTFQLKEQPVVEGTPYVDEVLTATAGTWTPTPRVMGWRWFADNVRIEGNDGATLALTTTLVGKTITVVPVARQDGYPTTTAPTITVGQVLMGNIALTRPTVVTGTPSVGATLTATDGAATPTDATLTRQWLRNGVPIAGATASSYRLTAADAGAKVSLQVNRTRKNYAPLAETVAVPGVVTSPAKITIVTDGRGRTAYARVRVTAPGVVPVTGKVIIRIGKWSDTVNLVDGRARVSVRVGTSGTKEVAVRYLGSTVVPAARATGSVNVL
ncbi:MULTISPECIES: CHAP domain-containing protein [unclassified Nocardioides]|uniref:CHAP domain-containing protein n=1 Tax=unclassified Nocardioides TaxID=2615069 RepID=UPI00138EFEB7|nr:MULTISPECIES: CHAP domain-containing protein [unclassified Nocardioides]